MDNYKAYAQLAILNGNGKPQTNSVNLVIDNQNVTCELLQVKNNTQTGYQVCRLGETQHLFFCNSLFIFIIKWQN